MTLLIKLYVCVADCPSFIELQGAGCLDSLKHKPVTGQLVSTKTLLSREIVMCMTAQSVN